MNDGSAAQAADVVAPPDTLQRLKELVVATAQLKITPEEISDTANLFNDCGIDSVSIVDLVLSVEEEFNITIGEDELDVRLFQDFSRLGAFVESKLLAFV